MNRLIDELKSKGLITEDHIGVLQHENSLISSLHIEFLESLEAKNKEKELMYIELVEEEEKTLKIIKMILRDKRFKRAYKNTENTKKIDNLLSYISQPNIQVTKGIKALNEIHNEMIIILDKQVDDEKIKLNNIKQDLGNVIWDELKDEFGKDRFLDYFI